MESKFIYVFNSEARDRLIRMGYKILKNDVRSSIFIFDSSSVANFNKNSLGDISFILSDSLTF